ncbi:MBL fold metallo-hydrolase [Jeotgalibacillus campisalis]|uniref:Metallo-beta-lactamase family protein n=1 Tax=Jeotgalibacillus campisalis TaxID=220754 RepID=A0A0C2RW60_9BACL|nr:MBL fold metallo-hydrolase [Jeotgalibacillus campisalis]KIL45984.1 metallo-beta-lactamase family protein [Jeotgalibacillus campisalis]
MEWIQMPLGPLQTNAYILYNKNLNCLIVDPGEEPGKIKSFIDKKQLKPAAIVLTHAHFDHIGAVDAIRETYDIPVYLHESERKWLGDPQKNGSAHFEGIPLIKGADPDHLFSEEGIVSVEGWTFQLFFTPGHSPGSVSIYFKEEKLVISGDALFQNSIGRTDLRGGDHDLLLKSIHQKLLTLPEDTYVLPGHGPVTSIQNEMNSNPFLHGF